MSAATVRCDFCGKSQHDVRQIIAGPTSSICDECVALCNDIIQEKGGSTPFRAGGSGQADIRLRAFGLVSQISGGKDFGTDLGMADRLTRWALGEPIPAADAPAEGGEA